jgi:uncharacterized protein YggE
MRTKFVLFTLLALALVLSACGPTTINQAAQPVVRTMNVNGVGQINLTPDIAYIYIGVHSEAATATEAVAANKTQTNAVIDAIKKAKVADKDIRTTNFSIYPSQKYGPDGTSTGETVYMVDNSVYVTVRNLDSLGGLLDDAVSAGANTINSITFDLADKTQAVKDARAKAVADAKTQAQEIATASGVSLGNIQNISFYDTSPIASPMYSGKGGGMAADASVPIQPGELTISVTVNLVYEIK